MYCKVNGGRGGWRLDEVLSWRVRMDDIKVNQGNTIPRPYPLVIV